ncbi:cardiolipin synthase [Oceanicola granulosus HTCC2516]|uniref:Phospholipase D n=1 Tax=Oceanicola granulosus (strain ATCC BAA-861 / DSM 15982 / KCTC 12143 / HTCC2516) TaxID=314256 RepID=Q2CB83_OCEGH|nr:phospholipase D-like domain-containing protein [Oceanicola granulosus]EAR49956.1 cardiolipin synthase [Oceanicola granulosus HTCC2516]
MTRDAQAENDHARWPCANPAWSLFHDNQAIWEAVFRQCEEARHSIDMEQYIIGKQGVGRDLLNLLARKAREGVAVRLLADGLGCRGLERSEGGRALRRAGGRISMFNPLSALLRHPVSRAPRLHRKTLIVDKARVMVGGSCYQDRMSTWRDTMIQVDGPLPPAITSAFDSAWRGARSNVDGTPPLETDGAAPDGWCFAASGPGPHTTPDLRKCLPERIAAAEESVSLTTPYLLPDRRLRRALIAAAGRGVRVRIVMPARSDHRPLDVLGHRFARSLARQGVTICFYKPRMLHAKVALIDGNWSSVSSFNLDLFSARLNLESGVFGTSAALHDALAAQMEADVASSDLLGGV